MEDVRDVLHMNDIAVRVEHFNETTHVRAFKFFGQIDEHADGCDSVLNTARLVADLDREPQATHADFVDAQIAMVAFALLIVHERSRFPRRLTRARGSIRLGTLLHEVTITALRSLAKDSLGVKCAFKMGAPSPIPL